MQHINISTQLCGIIVTVILLWFFLMQRKMNIRREKHFLRCIIVTIIVLVFDIAATVLNTFIPQDPFFTVYVNRLYLVATTVVLYSAILYIAGEIFSRKAYKKVFFSVLGFGIVMSTLIFFPQITTNEVTSEQNGLIIYTEGTATILTFATAFLGIVLTVVSSFVYEKKIGKTQAIAIRVWMGIWTGFAILQFFRKEMLICSFATSLGLLIMYISLEALDSSLDRDSGLFNWSGYCKYVDERRKDKEKCEIIYLKALDSIRILDEKIIYKALTDFDRLLKKRTDILAFRIQSEYLIVLKNGVKFTELSRIYYNSRNKYPIISTYYYPFYLADSTHIENQADLVSLINFATQNIKTDIYYTIIDNTMLAKYYEEIIVQGNIEDAIKNDLVVVYYQPIYNLAKKKFTSAEALVRLKTKQGRLIQPKEFIALAEKNGMIHKLDEIVFDKVCKFIKNNDMEALGLEYIESNLSVAQLCDNALSDKYISIIRENKVNTQYINLEITESAELEQRNTLNKNLEELKKFGITFSLDDYGTGYSNLNYVVDMPVSLVKFDKVMIDAYFSAEESHKAKVGIESSINMFRTLGLEIVCEGVEEQFQQDRLESMDVNFIQGFLHSKPIPEEEFIEFLKKHNK